MKKLLLLFIIIFSPHLLADFVKFATVKPQLVQGDSENKWCPITGLKIEDFYKTSYIAKLKSNGRERQYSCIYALTQDIQNSGIDLSSAQVLVSDIQKYMPVKSAFFLVDSSIEPTFGKISTIVFKSKKIATKFQKIYGGKIVDFKTALHVAQNHLKENISYMKKLYMKKLYPMGKRIYTKKCKKIDLSDYFEINELKSDIADNKLCGNLNEKHLQALSLYLWNVKREGGISNKNIHVKVTKEDKCPVCGMFVYKYPRWAAQIFYKHGNHEHHFSFDGVKDMTKFYFNANKWGKYDFALRKNITKMLVTDYYSQNAIDARNAYYVIGSDIYGPMGNELIPFVSKKDALNFKIDHKGTKILKFSEIKESLPYKLDTK